MYMYVLQFYLTIVSLPVYRAHFSHSVPPNPLSVFQSHRAHSQSSSRAPLPSQSDQTTPAAEPIQFREDQKRQYAEEGADFVLRCDVTGEPKPVVTWRGVAPLEMGPSEYRQRWDRVSTDTDGTE